MTFHIAPADTSSNNTATTVAHVHPTHAQLLARWNGEGVIICNVPDCPTCKAAS